jgi:hypothetical protein
MRAMWRQSTIPDDKSCPCFANRKSEEGCGHMIRITGQMQYRWRRFLENWWVSTTPSRRVRAVPSPRLSSSDRGKPPRRGWTHGRTPAQTFQAGEIVQQSGIYEAVHESGHRQPHEVVLIEADLFPPCDICAEDVRFRLVRSAPYIFTDVDFERPD